MKARLSLLPSSALLLMLSSPAPGQAATFTVNSTSDATDADLGDPACETAAGVCTLRAAIQQANAQPGPDTIVLPAGTYLLTIPNDGGDDESGDLDIHDDLIVAGAGAAGTIVDGGDSDRVFRITREDGSGADVHLAGITVRHGRAGADGGGIHVGRATVTLEDSVVTANVAPRHGGGLYVHFSGTLTVLRSTVAGNTASSEGGGIYNKGGETLHLTDSTVSGNHATRGGGIATDVAARSLITNSTISGNSATDQGGGLYGHGIVTLLHATISDNSTDGTGGGIAGTWGTYVDRIGPVAQPYASFVKNTLIAGNQAAASSPDCAMTVRTVGVFPSHTPSLGTNVIGDDTGCAGLVASDVVGTSPALGPLQDNGGPTWTHALDPGHANGAAASATATLVLRSPDASGTGFEVHVIDVSAVTACPSADQRGLGRPQGPGCDVGAYEIGVGGNTPAGTNVTVSLPPATLTFASVSGAGETQLTTGAAGPPPPLGFRVGQPPTYFDLTTTAVFSGPIQVCFDYGSLSFGQPSQLRLFHFDSGWVDVTSSLDTTAKSICGVTTSLSPFAIFEPDVAADTTPPVLGVPGAIVANATSPSGAVVSFAVSATDDSEEVAVACVPGSGSLFAIGTTTVRCTATDASGNRASAAFTIRVLGAEEQIVNMVERLRRMPLSAATRARLVDALRDALARPRQAAVVCKVLRLFAALVQLQAGRAIPVPLASELVADASRIRAVLGCL
jgi:CSLREA domain-containing protein